MKQRLDTEERLAQHADAQALARRSFLQRAAGLATVTAMAPAAFARNFGANTEPQRYPDPDIIALDNRFRRYIVGNTPIRRLHTGTLWAEGPAWNGVGRYLVWSDAPNNVQMRYIEDDARVRVHHLHINDRAGHRDDVLVVTVGIAVMSASSARPHEYSESDRHRDE